MEVSYMGETVTLEYAGESGLSDYAQFEKEWADLYGFVYQYLTKDIVP